MKRFTSLVFVSLIAGLVLLSACSSNNKTATVNPTATATTYATPDTSNVTLTTGIATVPGAAPAKPVSLYSRPDGKSRLAGLALPGEAGTVLGLDPTGAWVLVQFKEYTGWAPMQSLQVIISQ